MSESDDANATMAFKRGPMAPGVATTEDIGHYLVMIEGGEPGRRILLGSAPLTIGRDQARSLVLVDPDVSRFHVLVTLQRDQVLVEDQQSTNGTFINGRRISTALLAEGQSLQVGNHVLRLERRSKREVARSEELARDLAKASQYVRSLLPTRRTDGPVRTDWTFQPSAQLGGDAFGCDQIDTDTFVFYLIDVSGHGAGAAMHSVSVMNVLRQRALPNTDPRDPVQVLGGLNAMFQMDQHDGMFLTMWYGVYRVAARTLRYACAGHHPGYLVPPDRTTALPLKTPGLMIGASLDARFRAAETTVPAGSSLYLFSDGVFEIVTTDQRQWRLGDFVPLVIDAPREGVPESQRLQQAVLSAARPGPLDDDFSLMVVTFP